MRRSGSLQKILMLGKTGQEKGMTEDKMAGWHHRLNGHEFEQTQGDGERQGSLACCSPWVHKELDTNEQLNNNKKVQIQEAEIAKLMFLRNSLFPLLRRPLKGMGVRGRASLSGTKKPLLPPRSQKKFQIFLSLSFSKSLEPEIPLSRPCWQKLRTLGSS